MGLSALARQAVQLIETGDEAAVVGLLVTLQAEDELVTQTLQTYLKRVDAPPGSDPAAD